MGCILSKKKKSQSNYIRVVHLNGYIEDFDYPITVGEITGGTPPKQFLCTQVHLMSGCLKPLKQDTRLELGHIYFMLPYSTIQYESSLMDIATTAKRLVKLAKAGKGPLSNVSLPCSSSLRSDSPGRSPSQMAEISSIAEFGKVESCKVPGSWKPILDTIREDSFNRMSESDLKETHLEIII